MRLSIDIPKLTNVSGDARNSHEESASAPDNSINCPVFLQDLLYATALS
jgi:hypothetical protein